jgi:chromosome segregation ATPase
MMTSEPIDIDALIERLRNDDDVRRRLLAALLPQEFLALPLRVEQLAAAQAEQSERITRLERVVEQLIEAVNSLRQTVAALAQGQEELRASVAELRQTVAALAQGQEELRASIAELRQTVRELAEETAESIRRLTEWQVLAEQRLQRIEDRLGRLVGWRLEENYAKWAYAYFGTYLRSIRRADPEQIYETITAKLTREEVKDLSRADLIFQARLRSDPQQEVYLLMEVSGRIERNDVTRASRRADLLTKAGLPCVPAVGGEQIDPGVEETARELGVAVAVDGDLTGWETAFYKRLGRFA